MDLLKERLNELALRELRKRPDPTYRERRALRQSDLEFLADDLDRRIRGIRLTLWPVSIFAVAAGLFFGLRILSGAAEGTLSFVTGLVFLGGYPLLACFVMYRRMRQLAEMQTSMLCIRLLQEAVEEPVGA